MNVILSNYFTGKEDPQRDKPWKKDDAKLIRPWVKTLHQLNLNGIIFHNNLSNKFVSNHTTENLQFIHYELKTTWSVNDERFLCFYEFLRNNSQYDKVFTTDLFDVRFNKDPFVLVNGNHKYYACHNNGTIGRNRFMPPKMKKLYGKVFHPKNPGANAGVIGGKRKDLLFLFEGMIEDFARKDSPDNWNMPVFNKNLYDLADIDDILIGYPVTSGFKKYEKKGNFAIIHK